MTVTYPLFFSRTSPDLDPTWPGEKNPSEPRPPGGRPSRSNGEQLDERLEDHQPGGGDGSGRPGGGGRGGNGGGGNGGGGDEEDEDSWNEDDNPDPNQPTRRWVTVASFSLSTEAHLARLKLEHENIDCVIVDEHMISTNWLLSPALGGIKLQVPPDQARMARELLGDNAIPPSPWDERELAEFARCPHCGVGEFVQVPPSRWVLGISVLLLGLPLLFLPPRWACNHCRKPMTFQEPD